MSESLLSSVEIDPSGSAGAAVIWLHGLGANGHDFEPIVPYLRLPPELGVRFVFPDAPTQPVTINGGLEMPAWYDVYDMDIPRREDGIGIRNSARTIRTLIEREIGRGIPSDRIVLAGFSQGGAMALHTGLRYPDPLAGILALSCYLPMADNLSDEGSAANRATPILMMHGTHDEVIPVHYGEQCFQRLQTLGYPTHWQSYTMGHEVCPDQIQVIGAWLAERLAGGSE